MSYVRSFHKNIQWFPVSELDDFVVHPTLADLFNLPDSQKKKGKLYLARDTSRFYRYDEDNDTFIFLLEGLNDMVQQLEENGLLSVDVNNTTMTKNLTYELNRDVNSKGLDLGHNMTDVVNYLSLPTSAFPVDGAGNFIILQTLPDMLNDKLDVAGGTMSGDLVMQGNNVDVDGGTVTTTILSHNFCL